MSDTQHTLTQITSQRGIILPVIDGYVFHKAGRSETLFKCKKQSCNVRISVKKENDCFISFQFLNDNERHNHPSCGYEKKMVINKQLIDAAIDPKNRLEKTSKIMENINTEGDPRRMSTIAREFNSLRKDLYENKSYQNHPDYEKLLFFKDDEMMIFCNVNKMNKIKRISSMYMDGTFGSCPEDYYQIYTVHISSGSEEHFILAHCLLKGKDSVTYKKLFEVVTAMFNEKLKLNIWEFHPKIMVDFEVAVINSLVHYPCKVKGCYFHYCQSLYRKVQHIGLMGRYQEHGFVFFIIKSLMMLPHLKESDVENAYELIKGQVDEKNEVDLKPYLSYFEATWLNGLFKVALWNHYETITRTNNVTESYHSVLSKRITKKKPSPFEFVERISSQEKKEEERLNRLIQGESSRKRTKYIKNNKRIATLVQNYYSNLFTLQDLLKYLVNYSKNEDNIFEVNEPEPTNNELEKKFLMNEESYNEEAIPEEMEPESLEETKKRKKKLKSVCAPRKRIGICLTKKNVFNHSKIKKSVRKQLN